MLILSALPESLQDEEIDTFITGFCNIIEHSFLFPVDSLQGLTLPDPTLSSEWLNKWQIKMYSGMLRKEPLFSEVNLQKASKVLLI